MSAPAEDAFLEGAALSLFLEVHARLGHRGEEWTTRAGFDGGHPGRKRAWVEVARALAEGVRPKTRWLDDYAFELFQLVHERVGDVGEAFTRESFFSGSPGLDRRREAWREVARLLDERLAAEDRPPDVDAAIVFLEKAQAERAGGVFRTKAARQLDELVEWASRVRGRQAATNALSSALAELFRRADAGAPLTYEGARPDESYATADDMLVALVDMPASAWKDPRHSAAVAFAASTVLMVVREARALLKKPA